MFSFSYRTSLNPRNFNRPTASNKIKQQDLIAPLKIRKRRLPWKMKICV